MFKKENVPKKGIKLYKTKIIPITRKYWVKLFLSIFDTEEILHIYINKIIIPPRYKTTIVYINQFMFIIKNLILTTIDLITNIKQEIKSDLEKETKKIETKKTVFHKNIIYYNVVLKAQQICANPSLHGRIDFHAKFINLSYWYRGKVARIHIIKKIIIIDKIRTTIVQ